MNRFDKHLARYRQKGSKYLRANLPETHRLESLAELESLTLTRLEDWNEILSLQYFATAPTLFPAVRQRLIDRGIAKRHNILKTERKNKGTPNEIYNIVMGFYGNRLQISLDVHR